jgi:hypothetical protein
LYAITAAFQILSQFKKKVRIHVKETWSHISFAIIFLFHSFLLLLAAPALVSPFPASHYAQ